MITVYQYAGYQYKMMGGKLTRLRVAGGIHRDPDGADIDAATEKLTSMHDLDEIDIVEIRGGSGYVSLDADHGDAVRDQDGAS